LREGESRAEEHLRGDEVKQECLPDNPHAAPEEESLADGGGEDGANDGP
jgi:hypothetical protein